MDYPDSYNRATLGLQQLLDPAKRVNDSFISLMSSRNASTLEPLRPVLEVINGSWIDRLFLAISLPFVVGVQNPSLNCSALPTTHRALSSF